MGNKYTEQENTWAAMISNCRITQTKLIWYVKRYLMI